MNTYRITRAAFVGAMLIGFTAAASAQEKKTRLSFDIPASAAKYVAQHTLPVGDVDGHEVRIFDLVRTFGADAPSIGGVKIKEMRSVGHTDYTELNGWGAAYNTITMANGDKIYTRATIVSHNAAWANAGKKGAENKTSGPIVGGTGKFVSIRGTVRNASLFDPKSGSNSSRYDIEYWMAK